MCIEKLDEVWIDTAEVKWQPSQLQTSNDAPKRTEPYIFLQREREPNYFDKFDK